MSRCPDCNKFVGQEMKAEIESVDAAFEVDGESCDGATVTAEVRIVAECAECSSELKEGQLTIEQELDEPTLKAINDHLSQHAVAITTEIIGAAMKEEMKAGVGPCEECKEEGERVKIEDGRAFCGKCLEGYANDRARERVEEEFDLGVEDVSGGEPDVTDRVEGKGRGARTFYGRRWRSRFNARAGRRSRRSRSRTISRRRRWMN